VEEEQGVALPIAYVGLEDIVIAHANHFVLQIDRGEFILTVGQVVPPLLLGDEDEKREQAKQIAYVAARPLARVVLNRTRVAELRELCERQLALFDARFGGEQ
jgi:hypothetical protein